MFVKLDSCPHAISEIPQYKNLSWRLDIEVDRRAIRRITEPLFIMKFDTTENSQYLTAQYHDLKHVCETLENALREMKQKHVRRIKKLDKK